MRSFILCLACVLGPAAAANAGITPILRYTWGSATSFTHNQEFTGPALYTQTISVTGLSGPVGQFSVYLATGTCWAAYGPDAWAALCGAGLDCRGNAGAFTWSDVVADCATISGLSLQVNFGGNVTQPTGYILIDGVVDPPLNADPSIRYGIATLTFDHTNSIAGASDGVHCGDADRSFCFGIQSAAFVYPNPLGTVPATLETHDLSWQNATGTVDCFGAVPARPTSWGQLKTIYR